MPLYTYTHTPGCVFDTTTCTWDSGQTWREPVPKVVRDWHWPLDLKVGYSEAVLHVSDYSWQNITDTW